MSDLGRFPALRAYVEGLPSGIDSHPQCQAKASMCRTVLDAKPLPAEVAKQLPPPLTKLVEHPPPVSSWIPETHSRAVLLAIYDHHFGDPGAFDAWAYESQRKLFEGPLYAVAMRVISARMLAKAMPLRWRMFHRGTDAQVVELGDHHCRVRFEFPQGIYDAISLIGLTSGLRAALDGTVRGQSTVEVADASPTHAEIEARWT